MFDMKKIKEMEKEAGKKLDIRPFYLLFSIPILLSFYNLLLAFISFFLILQLPKIYLWFLIKSRRRKIERELPLASYSLSWLFSIYPVPIALSKFEEGEIGKMFRRVCERYEKGESFEKSLEEISDEEFRELLLYVYKTGKGKVLESFAKRKANEYRVKLRERGAKLQLYSTVFVTVSTVFPAVLTSIATFSKTKVSLLLPAIISLGVWLLWKLQE